MSQTIDQIQLQYENQESQQYKIVQQIFCLYKITFFSIIYARNMKIVRLQLYFRPLLQLFILILKLFCTETSSRMSQNKIIASTYISGKASESHEQIESSSSGNSIRHQDISQRVIPLHPYKSSKIYQIHSATQLRRKSSSTDSIQEEKVKQQHEKNQKQQKVHEKVQKKNKNKQNSLGFTPQEIHIVESRKVLFISGRQNTIEPKKQNYWDMLKFIFCPSFRFCSFTTICLVVYLALFITSIALGINRQGSLLQIQTAVLIRLGANSPQLVRNGEVWRLLTAAVLHVDLIHFFGNFFATIMLLPRIQYTLGPLRTFILYLISAIGGNIFSALCSFDTIKVGASTCLYGVLGFSLGYIIINWRGLNLIGKMLKCQLTISVVLLVLFTVMFTAATGGNIDYYGHLGGFLIGLWSPYLGNTVAETKRERTLKIVFGLLFVLQVILCIIMFLVIRFSDEEQFVV